LHQSVAINLTLKIRSG